MKKFWIPFFILLGLSFGAAARTDIVGTMGHSQGFFGHFPIVGGMGPGGAVVVSCPTGAIDASTGCPLPMLGL